ncbi:PorT family protein [Muricauda sp. SCSIO 64092]|uniref:PorT family protein n=1 Tax=Allomuricauda sp. SCSIO 64092 TaxID=2908842 RepID=UPI001FF15590|nr:PorT family protein [Muricauda sp. SCSIO 64092]UOY07067.1 PorT family protein [Muricauda sp. SCSIO 64092]
MTKTITICLFFTSLVMFSQTRFEKGYFIESKGDKVECYIRNLNWADSPIKVSYKLSLGDEPKFFDVNTVKAFQVNEGPLYLKVSGEFPVTQQFEKDKSSESQPKLVSRNVFVKRILGGEASLYQYSGNNDRIFLIQIGEHKPLPLLYKQYIKPGSNQIVDNKMYRRQLFEHLNCGNSIDIQSVTYEKKSLINYVQKYNLCTDPNSSDLEMGVGKRKGIKFGLTIYGGAQDYDFNYAVFGRDQDYDNEIVPKVGLEVEGILPFNNDKWSFFLGAFYSEYSSGFGRSNVGSPRYFIDINRLEVILGGRHYMYLNPNSALFLELGLTIDNDFSSEHRIDFNQDTADSSQQVRPVNLGSGLGVGYSFKRKLYLKFNYYLNQNVLEGTPVENELSRVSLLLGYKFL